jgi:hypothetical protein
LILSKFHRIFFSQILKKNQKTKEKSFQVWCFPFYGRFLNEYGAYRGFIEIIYWVRKNSRKIFTFAVRRNGRVVDRGGLENRCACEGTGGSNPSFSAKA